MDSKRFQPSSQSLNQCLIITAVIVVLADIGFAVCIGLVLPDYFLHSYGYRTRNGRYSTYLDNHCNCNQFEYFQNGTSRAREPQPIGQFRRSQEVVPPEPQPEELPEDETNQLTDEVPDQFQDEETDQPPEPKLRILEQESSHEIIKTFPFVVSLTLPGYTQDQRFFACNGFIIAKNWALTSKYCVEDKSYWRYVKVRSGSSYWSKDGYEHDVVEVVDAPQNGIVAIKIHPNFIFAYNPTDTVRPIKFITELDLQWSMALGVGFANNFYDLPFEKRTKFQMFTVDKYTTLPCPKSYTYKFCNKTDNVQFSGKPLVSECKHFLLGMEIIGKPNMFYDINQKAIIDFLKNLVKPIENPIRYKRSVQDNCIDLFRANCLIAKHFHCVDN